MKRNYNFRFKCILLNLFLLTMVLAKAQYVTIPDPDFVKYLKKNYASCINGNQLDTSCAEVKTAEYFYLNSLLIHDLSGIEFFPNLKYLSCRNDSLKFLPPLNMKKLEAVDCAYNQLESLPDFSSSKLVSLVCSNNFLFNLPKLPSTLCTLECASNRLTWLPELKNPLFEVLVCDNNKITCLPSLPLDLVYVKLLPNPFKCLPNHVARMDSTLLTYPICKNNDPVNNPFACPSSIGVSGSVYQDMNNNCKWDNGEKKLNNIRLKLYDKSNTVIGKTFTYANGHYELPSKIGFDSVRVEVDSLDMLFKITCAHPGNDSSVILTPTKSWVENIDFGVVCKSAIDIAVQSVNTTGWVFPGLKHMLHVYAGDVTKWLDLNCGNNVGGKLRLTVSGPVTYDGVPNGAMIPVIAGSSYTYTITNFSTIPDDLFRLVFKTNTTATARDSICVNVEVTPSVFDIKPLNNKYNFCYKVVNSYDPNIKEVYPFDEVNEGYNSWFTYTIHFQNTGNAPAMNIRLADSLDKNLDPETFQVSSYSHYNQVMLDKDRLEFRFPDIQLIDSTTDQEASKGFVQYRIKPKSNLKGGTIIKNTASIYFDYNAPVVTNTTINHYTKTVGIPENSNKESILIYPNPGNGHFQVEFGDKTDIQNMIIEVYTILGKIVWRTTVSAKTIPMDLSHLVNGVYVVKIQGKEETINQRLIKQ